MLALDKYDGDEMGAWVLLDEDAAAVGEAEAEVETETAEGVEAAGLDLVRAAEFLNWA